MNTQHRVERARTQLRLRQHDAQQLAWARQFDERMAGIARIRATPEARRTAADRALLATFDAGEVLARAGAAVRESAKVLLPLLGV